MQPTDPLDSSLLQSSLLIVSKMKNLFECHSIETVFEAIVGWLCCYAALFHHPFMAKYRVHSVAVTNKLNNGLCVIKYPLKQLYYIIMRSISGLSVLANVAKFKFSNSGRSISTKHLHERSFTGMTCTQQRCYCFKRDLCIPPSSRAFFKGRNRGSRLSNDEIGTQSHP